MNDMLIIDGSEGEGGGQILRSSLALSICLGKPFTIQNIRARRKKPGLLRQHLTAVKAAARISNAKVEGDNLKSQELIFEPSQIQAGEFHFSIGSAGSTSLVLQTILIPLLFAKGESKVIIEGGTHNPLAPPFDFLQHAYFPLLAKMGAEINAKLVRPGFFPSGGGRIEVEVQPVAQLRPLTLLERGNVKSIEGNVYIAGLPLDIAERERKVLARKLDLSINHIEIKTYGAEYGLTNMVSVFVKSDHVCEVFTGYGQKGVKAEIVAKRVVNEVQRYIDSAAPVDEHLADQLLLPMALAGGGEFVANSLSSHTATNIDVIKKFVNITTTISELSDTKYNIHIG